MTLLSIPKNIVSTLPKISFAGKIIVVENKIECELAVKSLLKESIIGIDTETRPAFKKGIKHKVALIQISKSDVCYLFRINKMGLPKSLRLLLENENIMKIGLSLKDDIHRISEMKAFTPSNFVDIQEVVKNYGIIDNSLQRIFAIIFKRYISKSQQLSNWESDSLTDKQQVYAATDAWACLKIYQHLTNNKFNPENSIYKYIPPETIETDEN